MTAFDGARQEWPDDLTQREAEVCGDALGIDGAQLVAERMPGCLWCAIATVLFFAVALLATLATLAMAVMEEWGWLR